MNRISLAIGLIASIVLSLAGAGSVRIFEYFTHMPYGAQDFETRIMVPLVGTFAAMGCLFLLVPLYRIVVVQEWRSRWAVEARAYWETQKNLTIQDLNEWIAAKDWDETEKKLASRSVRLMEMQSPPLIH